MPVQRLLSACVWKEYTTDAGRVYYHNTETKESSWLMPHELHEIKEAIAAEEEAARTEGAADEPGSSALDEAMAKTLAAIEPPPEAPLPAAIPIPEPREFPGAAESDGTSPGSPALAETLYRDKKEAIEAFKELLREKVSARRLRVGHARTPAGWRSLHVPLVRFTEHLVDSNVGAVCTSAGSRAALRRLQEAQ